MSRVLPILFNDDMVWAILDGRKTVTRQAIKNCPTSAEWYGWLLSSSSKQDAKDIGKAGFKINGQEECTLFKPRYQIGDILYVREAWRQNMDGYSGIDFGGYAHRAGFAIVFKDEYNPWHSPASMPKEAARIWLRVTDVRVGRLRDITQEDLYNEGITQRLATKLGLSVSVSEEEFNFGDGIRRTFIKYWDKLAKRESQKFDADPWVWAIEFERCEKPGEVDRWMN